MKIKNNKGFTLPELLAAVVIIGILSSIAIVSVNNVMKKSHKEYDIKQNKLFTTAAQTYFTDNRSKLPKKLLTESEVTLSELIKENYIEEIVDYKKELYNQEESKAYVKKMGRGKYKYYSELIGSDGRKISDKEESKKSGDIKITITNYDRSETDMPRSNNLNIETYYVNKKLKIDIQGSATGEGISSYQYKIERLSSIKSKTGKKYKESGEIEVDNKILNDTITIDAKDFANGIYKLVVYAYGYDGNTFNTVESKTIVIDKTKPKCNIKMDGTPGFGVENAPGNYWYKKGNLTAKMNIKEQNKYKYTIGLNEQTYNIEYNKNNIKDEEEYPITNNVVGKYVYGYIQDKAGNIGKCQTEKPIYYDNTNPTCDIKLDPEIPNGANGWYVSDVRLNLNSVDEEQGLNESGVRDQELTKDSYNFPIPVPNVYTNKTYDIQGETKGQMWYGYVRDKAGNEGKCDTGADVKVEVTSPTCTSIINGTKGKINGKETGWYTSNVNIYGQCNKSISNCNNTNSTTLNTSGSYSPGSIQDEAGKTAQCDNVSVSIDKRAPECSVNSGCNTSTSGTSMCAADGAYYYATCKDSESKCYSQAYFNSSGTTSGENKFRNPDSDGDFVYTIKSGGTSTIYYTVYDNAGNSTNCNSKTYKIDNTPPKIISDDLCTTTEKKGCICPNDNNTVYPYVINYTVKDYADSAEQESGSGYDAGTFTWPSGTSDPEYNKPVKSKHWICSSGKSGVYTYDICDWVGNCSGKHSRKMDGSS